MVAGPAPTPVTTPEALTVATVVAELLHVPAGPSLSADVDPMHMLTADAGSMAAGPAVTVIVVVLTHPPPTV